MHAILKVVSKFVLSKEIHIRNHLCTTRMAKLAHIEILLTCFKVIKPTWMPLKRNNHLIMGRSINDIRYDLTSHESCLIA